MKTCLEYGCGVGRVTHWLAGIFERVHGFDISQPHLQIARRFMDSHDIHNVDLRQVDEISDLSDLPKVDFLYSVIVLQHNPPPVISYTIRQFIRALNPGGVALFQVPTYRLGYSFSLPAYLSSPADDSEIEMHVLPQKPIFDILWEEGGKPLEVIEDDWTGVRHLKEVSTTFLVQKQ
jgi:SAM-dependent methyltransferase